MDAKSYETAIVQVKKYEELQARKDRLKVLAKLAESSIEEENLLGINTVNSTFFVIGSDKEIIANAIKEAANKQILEIEKLQEEI